MENNYLPKNILVVKHRALGDAVIGLSSITYLKKQFADSKVSYLVPQWVFPLFQSVVTDVDHFLPIKLNSLLDALNLFWQLFANKYDLIIELHQRGRTAKFFKLYSFLTRTPYFYHNHNKTERAPAIARDLHGCYVAVKKYLPDAVKPEYLDFEPSIKVLDAQENRKQIIFGVVATRETKMWPITNYKLLSDLIVNHDPLVEIIIPLSNSHMDNKLEEEFKALNPSPRVKFIKVGLEQLPMALSQASYYIGNDTGLKHICVALGLNTYTFFGPEEPFEWHPYNTKKHKYFYLEKLSCRTRRTHYCDLTDCNTLHCLRHFNAPDIFEAIAEFL